jgi:hypothetical protein
MVRFPGGGLADRFDPLADGGQGVVYNDSDSTEPADTSLAQFVHWCQSVSCESIVTLPAEINNSSEARAIVSYTESVLGFHPTYWEVGNEPALWEHFGVAWSRWNTSQAFAPTPSQFAGVVARYIQAIRSVDPSTGIIGMGGLGKGSSGQAAWVSAVVGENGANLAAIAIHVYPAGSGYPSSDLAAWFGSLTGGNALLSRVPNALDQVRAACSTCHIGVLADEFQTGTQLSASDALSGGYLATYIAAEIAQGISVPLASLDYYDFQSGTLGAWLNTKGTPSASLYLYQGIASQLGAFAVPESVTSTAPGLLAVEGGGASASPDALMLVNTNVSYGFHVNLTTRFPSAGAGTSWLFRGGSSAPTTAPLTVGAARNWTIPPASVALFHGLGPFNEGVRVPNLPSEPRRASSDLSGTVPIPHPSFPGFRPAPLSTIGSVAPANQVSEFKRIRVPHRGRASRTPRSGRSA